MSDMPAESHEILERIRDLRETVDVRIESGARWLPWLEVDEVVVPKALVRTLDDILTHFNPASEETRQALVDFHALVEGMEP